MLLCVVNVALQAQVEAEKEHEGAVHVLEVKKDHSMPPVSVYHIFLN